MQPEKYYLRSYSPMVKMPSQRSIENAKYMNMAVKNCAEELYRQGIDVEVIPQGSKVTFEYTENATISRSVYENVFYNELRERYIKILGSESECTPDDPMNNKHLVWMLTELSSTEMSETKKHRWLGYIQGIMTSKGLITVKEERDLTRGIFNGK